MDRDSFAAWLDGIRCLTAEQRSLGFRGLALAEAADSAEAAEFVPPAVIEASVPALTEHAPSGLAERAGVRARSAPDNAIAASVEAVSVTDAAAYKVALTGCPHCASR